MVGDLVEIFKKLKDKNKNQLKSEKLKVTEVSKLQKAKEGSVKPKHNANNAEEKQNMVANSSGAVPEDSEILD